MSCVFHAVYMCDLHGLILCTIYNTRNIHGKHWLKNLLTIRVSLRLFFDLRFLQPNRHWQPESKFFFLGNHSGFTIQALFSRCTTPVSFVFGWVDFKRTRSRNPGEIHFFNQPADIGNKATQIPTRRIIHSRMAFRLQFWDGCPFFWVGECQMNYFQCAWGCL